MYKREIMAQLRGWAGSRLQDVGQLDRVLEHIEMIPVEQE